MKFKLHIFICVWITALFFHQANGQNKAPIFTELAKPFVWEISLAKPGTQPFTIGDSLGVFEILDIKNKVDTGVTSPDTYKLLLVAYDTGNFQIPTIYPHTGNNALMQIKVLAPGQDAIASYAPPKEIIQYYEDTSSDFCYYWLLALIPLILAAIWYFFFRKQKKSSLLIPPPGTDPMEILQQLRSPWQQQSISPVQLGEGMMRSLYAHIRAEREITTQKIARKLMQKALPFPKQNLQQILMDIDAWRFGKQIPTLDQGLSHIDQLSLLIREQMPAPNHA